MALRACHKRGVNTLWPSAKTQSGSLVAMDLNVVQNGALPFPMDVPRRSSRGGRIFLHLMLAVLGALLGAGFSY